MTVDQTVLEAKRYGIFSCKPEQTLLQAACQMAEKDVSALVVLDHQNRLQGVLSRTDLIRALVFEPEWTQKTVSEFMSQDVVLVSAETTLKEAARILINRQIHRVVVTKRTDGINHPISVISSADIVYHMAKEKAQPGQ